MAKKSSSKTVTPAATELSFEEQLKGIAVKVNTSNIVELKNAIDDGVKLHLSKVGFVESHQKEDIRLVLGWTSALVAFAAAYHGYTSDFQESKVLVAIGVGINLILSAALTYHIKFIEKDIIFEGKRRTFASRVSTESITIHSNASNGNKPLFNPQTYLQSFFLPKSSIKLPFYPCYSLSANYSHSSNAGKSILKQGQGGFLKSVGCFFDQSGRFCKGALEMELGKVVKQVVGEE